MALPNVEVNYLFVLVAAIVSFVFGWLWYGPLFGRAWAREMKFGPKEMKATKEKGMAGPMVLNFVGTFVRVYVFAMFIGYLGIGNFGDLVVLALWVWLGFFAATTLLGEKLWRNGTWSLYVINAAYWLINLEIVGMILVAWG